VAEWWGPRLVGWGKTVRGGIVIISLAVSAVAGSVTFTIYKAKQIGEYLDLPGRAARHERQDSLLFELATANLQRDSIQESRILYYFRAMHCIHDGYEDTSEFLDCPHFREELIAALSKAEGRAGPVED
jgi:hypothetical protein